jgi:hypothetical protein
MTSYKRRIFIGVVLVLLISCLTILFKYTKDKKIEAALELGSLAPLPGSAKSIKVETSGGLFSRTFWLSFKADKEDIDKWTRGANILVRSKDTLYLRQRLIDAPDWFYPSAAKTTRFEIPQDQDANYGTLFIDEEANIVYVKTSHS